MDASFFPPMDALDVWYFGWTDVSRGDGILFWWCTFSWIGFHRILYVFVLVHSPSMTLDRPWCWLFHPCHRIWVGLSPLSSHVGIHRLGLTHLFYRWEGRRGAFWSPSIPPPLSIDLDWFHPLPSIPSRISHRTTWVAATPHQPPTPPPRQPDTRTHTPKRDDGWRRQMPRGCDATVLPWCRCEGGWENTRMSYVPNDPRTSP